MPTSDFYSDTDPKVLEVWIEGFRKMIPERRVAMALDHSRLLFGLVEANVRHTYPQADDRQVFLRVAARHLDRDTMMRAYNWDPDLNR